MHDCAEAHEISLGKLGQPIRVAITGGAVSPPIDVTLALVGRKKALQRLDRAIGLIKERAASG
jgi:glutamyl-tRNA synthetase